MERALAAFTGKNPAHSDEATFVKYEKKREI
jgi:hypothetical protein